MTSILNSILLFAQQSAPAGDGTTSTGGGYMSIIFMVLLIAIFYLFFIRPSVKKQKEAKKYQESLGKGSKIVTIGGIHGKIVEVHETTFTIETEGTKMLIEKSAVNAEFAKTNPNQQGK
ncbi:preprotein translocase subunit YajC [Bacteroidales bacterium OttesenSCG-928-L14]|nr:preprotein translocase subunit YajC [Bacteroidales bacterium OttesenSCG-928-L14]